MTVFFVVLSVILAAIDRFTKAMAESRLIPGQPVDVIKAGDRRIFWFSLYHNTGAAFSSFSGKTVILSIVTALLLAALFIYFLKSNKNKWDTVSMAMIMGGGIGNLFDRIVYGEVTDFLNLFPFNFVFNFADICVVFGVIMLIGKMILVPDKEKTEKAADNTAEDGAE